MAAVHTSQRMRIVISSKPARNTLRRIKVLAEGLLPASCTPTIMANKSQTGLRHGEGRLNVKVRGMDMSSMNMLSRDMLSRELLSRSMSNRRVGDLQDLWLRNAKAGGQLLLMLASEMFRDYEASAKIVSDSHSLWLIFIVKVLRLHRKVAKSGCAPVARLLRDFSPEIYRRASLWNSNKIDLHIRTSSLVKNVSYSVSGSIDQRWHKPNAHVTVVMRVILLTISRSLPLASESHCYFLPSCCLVQL